jgi:hypothetical protein
MVHGIKISIFRECYKHRGFFVPRRLMLRDPCLTVLDKLPTLCAVVNMPDSKEEVLPETQLKPAGKEGK